MPVSPEIIYIIAIVALLVMNVLSYRHIAELQRYIMANKDVAAYVTSHTKLDEPPEIATEEQQRLRALKEYDRMVMGGEVTPKQIKEYEEKYGIKEDMFA